MSKLWRRWFIGRVAGYVLLLPWIGTVIAGVSGAFCTACSEAVLDDGVAERVAEAMQAFARQVDGYVASG